MVYSWGVFVFKDNQRLQSSYFKNKLVVLKGTFFELMKQGTHSVRLHDTQENLIIVLVQLWLDY